ncbi:enolase C-terminal domain-like protein [Nocardia sp. NPDC058518]|uniref:enolase C-terminal domain-like protein n=1 Tax=Nocardia sp. NPDC058518 TaxID=3346534 RepID=UPI003665A94D
MGTHTITAVITRMLPALPDAAPAADVLPDWAGPARCRPAAQPWPENLTRMAIGVVDNTGATGWFGPVSAGVAVLALDQVAPAVIGRDVDAWRAMASLIPQGRHRHGGHVRLAVSAVELAAWDLRSNLANVAVGVLLGGERRARVPVYATALGIDIDHPLAPDIACWLAGEGFWAQKWGLPGAVRGETPRTDAVRLQRIRDAVGDEARICVDVGGRWSADYARRMLPVLAEVGVCWVEEPGALSDTDLARHGLARAAGEHDYDPVDQLGSLGGDVQIWQPDPTWCGGLAHALSMVELAALRGIRSLPHGSGLAVALALAASAPADAVAAIEYHLTLEPLRQDHQLEPLVPVAGELEARTVAGLTSGYRFEEGETDAAA